VNRVPDLSPENMADQGALAREIDALDDVDLIRLAAAAVHALSHRVPYTPEQILRETLDAIDGVHRQGLP
jgi:hypothetical protein